MFPPSKGSSTGSTVSFKFSIRMVSPQANALSMVFKNLNTKTKPYLLDDVLVTEQYISALDYTNEKYLYKSSIKTSSIALKKIFSSG